jgi:hypothetical protein
MIELEDLVHNARSRRGANYVPTNTRGIRALYKAVGKGGTVAMLPDQEPRTGGGCYAPFFGMPAYSMALLVRLSKRTGAPIVLTYCERLARGRGYHIHFREAPQEIYSLDTENAVTAMNQAVEGLIRECPTQYQWSYRRFSIRPEGKRLSMIEQYLMPLNPVGVMYPVIIHPGDRLSNPPCRCGSDCEAHCIPCGFTMPEISNAFLEPFQKHLHLFHRLDIALSPGCLNSRLIDLYSALVITQRLQSLAVNLPGGRISRILSDSLLQVLHRTLASPCLSKILPSEAQQCIIQPAASVASRFRAYPSYSSTRVQTKSAK